MGLVKDVLERGFKQPHHSVPQLLELPNQRAIAHSSTGFSAASAPRGECRLSLPIFESMPNEKGTPAAVQLIHSARVAVVAGHVLVV